MEVVFGLFSTFSDPFTRRKFQMIAGGRTRAALLEYIAPAELPTRWVL